MRGKRILIMLGIMALAGCATIGKGADTETESLRNQLTLLESQLQEKDLQIAALQEALSQGANPSQEAISGVSTKDIQVALQNAGYDPGKLDGVMGRKTRKALKDFQRANGLSVTGKADKGTWLLLEQYLQKKVK